MLCAVWYHLYNLKNMKITHGRVLLLVKLQALACSFAKGNTPVWVFFTFFKLYKWYQIAQKRHIRNKAPSKMFVEILYAPRINKYAWHDEKLSKMTNEVK